MSTKTIFTKGINGIKATIINQSDLGTECWSTDRLVENDCTLCDRHHLRRPFCKYSVKGVYPNADPGKLYRTQLALLELKQGIRQLLGKEQRR